MSSINRDDDSANKLFRDKQLQLQGPKVNGMVVLRQAKCNNVPA